MTGSRRRWIGCFVGGVALLATACGGAAAPAGQSGSGATAKPAAPSSSAAPASSSSTAAPSGPLGALYAQAKQEGQVVFEDPTPLSEFQPVLNLFRQKFPGVQVHYTDVTAEQAMQSLMTQEAAHNVQFDLTQGADDNLALLTDHHLMATVDWAKYGVPANQVTDGQWVRWYDLPNVVAYNTNLVKGSEIPASWNDLLNPRWSGGKIAIDGRGHFLNAFLADPSLGEAAGVAFAKKLAAQKPLDEARLSSANQAIASGEVPVGTTDMEQMLVAKDKGAPIDLAPVSPVIATAFGLYVPPGAPHPAAAELLAAWLVTPKAEAALQKASYYALASPCSASRMAGMFCAKHVTVEHLGSLANIRKDPAYLKSVEQALGTYKGK